MPQHEMNLPHLLRQFGRRPVSALAVAGCLSCAVVWPAAAQDCYRVVDIKALGFIPNPNDITFGINDQHEAVGAYMVGQKKHAFLWLPAAAYSLTAGFHDLHTLAGLDEDAQSATYEINNAGMAVGWTDDSGAQHAFVWQIAAPLSTIDLATYSVPDNGPPKLDVARVAWAINNADPPVVVGDASGLSNCACPPNADNFGTQLGFSAVLDGTKMLDELLPIINPPNDCDVSSFGRDVGALVIGYSAGTGIGFCVPPLLPCDPTKDSVYFFSGGAAAALADFSDGASESRGANDTGSITGWGFENDDNPCQMSALFWQTSSSVPFNLNSLLPMGHQSRAEAISNPDGGGTMLVVGSNETTQHALRWQGSGVTWSVVDLNDKIVNQCGSGLIVVRQSQDLSNDGWIVAWADFDPGPSIDAHAVILVPDQNCVVCCFADLDCSGNVGVSDLLALRAAWGPCLGCAADLDCDGAVGVSDLLLLLAAWNTCEINPPSEIPKTVQDCVDKFYPNDLEALIACIEALSG